MPSLKYFVLLFLLLFSNIIVGDEMSPDEVKSVVSKNGHYRVLLKQKGFEHVSTEVQLDWLDASAKKQKTQIVKHSKTIVEAGFNSLSSARFYVKNKKQYLELSGAHTYSYEKVRFTFLVLPDGVVKQIPINE